MDWLSDIKTPAEQEQAKRDAKPEKDPVAEAYESVKDFVPRLLNDLGRHWYEPSWFAGFRVYPGAGKHRFWVLAKGRNKVKVNVYCQDRPFRFSIFNGFPEYRETDVESGAPSLYVTGASQQIFTDDLSETSLKKALREVAALGPLQWHD